MLRNISTILLLLISLSVAGQKSSISLEKIDLLTYPYSDPDPVPVLAQGKERIYPYHSFNGYALNGKNQVWDVVKLENDYVVVWVIPAAGGKVWGAIEKSTGKEFIYRNEVMKFRNISMRGPWTSGGIEFNFGIIGHSPSTCVAVDYKMTENSDGSVSCIVGNTDLPSRTKWNVEVRLPADKAYFETFATWINPSGLPQTYYNWMTAAAVVTDDLEFEYPGSAEIGHSGEFGLWPVNKDGRKVSWYRENNFGSSKSYHIVGEYNDFMGGYYHNSDFGFGHWALYDEMPGHKLWLWSLARDGGIWEDLLTDTDGQYMEFQAGRMFNQYGGTSAFKTPVSQTPFEPDLTDTWHEIWFPVKEIGGITDVSPFGAMNIEKEGGRLTIGINSFAFADATIRIIADNEVLLEETINFNPMDVYKKSVDLKGKEDYEITVNGMDLQYDPSKIKLLNRPFESSMPKNLITASSLYQEGMELKEMRNYSKAAGLFRKCLSKDPLYIDAYAALAEIFYRSMNYDSVFHCTERAIELDAYHPAANYFAGLTYMEYDDVTNALESLGWAARSPQYRSAAYEKMAAAKFKVKDLKLAEHYASQSIVYNSQNLNSLQLLSLVYRHNGEKEKAEKYLRKVESIDRLSHFAGYERYRLNPSAENRNAFISSAGGEMPYQTFLELSIWYFRAGLTKEAADILSMSPPHPLVRIWQAYTGDNPSLLSECEAMSPAFVFPYRTETIKALEWAADNHSGWKFKYYLALGYTAINQKEEANRLLAECGQEADFAPFYLTRAALLDDEKTELMDLLKARELAPSDWRTAVRLIGWYRAHNDNRSELSIASEAFKKHKDNSTLGIEYAIALINNGRYAESLKTLDGMVVLPNEGSNQGKRVFEQSTLSLSADLLKSKKYKEALKMIGRSREWPENLGVGKPYNADTRIQDYMEIFCLEKLNRPAEAKEITRSLLSDTGQRRVPSFNNLLVLKILQKNGDDKAAANMLNYLRKSGNSVDEWIIAKAENNLPAAGKLEKEFSSNQGFLIIKKVLEATE